MTAKSIDLTFTVHFDHEKADPSVGFEEQIVIEGIKLHGMDDYGNNRLWIATDQLMNLQLQHLVWKRMIDEKQREIDDHAMERGIDRAMRYLHQGE